MSVQTRVVQGIAMAAVVGVGALQLAGCKTGGGGEPQVPGPHRVAAAGAAGAGGEGGGSRHWIALSRAWAVPTGDPAEKTGLGKSTSEKIGTDGTRVFTIESVIPPATGTDPWPPGTLSAYDGANGKLLWKTKFQWPGKATPVAGDGIVVLAEGTGLEGAAEPQRYVALDAATGKERWHRTVKLRPQSPIDQFNFTPGVFLGNLYYYADGSHTYAIDPATGRVKRQHVSNGLDVVAGPVVAGDQLALVTRPEAGVAGTEHLTVVNRDFSLASTYTYPDSQAAPNCAPYYDNGLAAAGDILVSWNDSLLCATDKNAGKLLWIKPIHRQYLEPVVSGVIPVYQDTGDTNLVTGIDARTGRQLWSNRGPDEAFARTGIGVADGTLFSLGLHVQIIDPKTGKTAFDMQPRLGGDLTGGKGTYGENNYGGDAIPVYAAGHIVMIRADGLWGFN
jgi:outer membrane protein assembly factor BamB